MPPPATAARGRGRERLPGGPPAARAGRAHARGGPGWDAVELARSGSWNALARALLEDALAERPRRQAGPRPGALPGDAARRRAHDVRRAARGLARHLAAPALHDLPGPRQALTRPTPGRSRARREPSRPLAEGPMHTGAPASPGLAPEDAQPPRGPEGRPGGPPRRRRCRRPPEGPARARRRVPAGPQEARCTPCRNRSRPASSRSRRRRAAVPERLRPVRAQNARITGLTGSTPLPRRRRRSGGRPPTA